MARPLPTLLSLVAASIAPLAAAAEGGGVLEIVRDPVAEAVLAEIMDEALGQRDSEESELDEAALIVGALLGLAALERAARDERGAEQVPGLAPDPEPLLLPEVPARPAEIEAMSDAARPEPLAQAPLGPPRPIGEPSLEIPPPPPMAERPSDVALSLDRAAREGDTGF